MTYAMNVRLPVSVPYGTDEEFDLRVNLEAELATAVAAAGTGELAGGGIDDTHITLKLDNFDDPSVMLDAVKDVLAGADLLGRAVIVLETRCPADPDDPDREVLWPPALAGAGAVCVG